MGHFDAPLSPEPNVPRILPPFYFFAALILMLLLDAFVPLVEWIPREWGFSGLVPIVIGVGLNASVYRLFRRHDTTILPFRESHSLVTEGPFRYSRNPIYLGGALILTGLAITLGSLTPFLVVPLFIRIIDARFIRREEEALTRQFGEEYREFKTRVRRWL